VKYALLPLDWQESTANFDPAKNSLFKIDSNIAGHMTGKSACGCFALTVSSNAIDLVERLYDFIQYENEHGRKVQVFSRDVDVRTLLRNSQPKREAVRYAVHSTLLSSYEQIQKDGRLKSTARLRREGLNRTAIGFAPLGEPTDYLEYVMFAPVDDSIGNEMVVNSHLRGAVCYDPNAAYAPQARMYFDAAKIASDGLAVYDGAHFLKVYDALPLAGYHLLTVFVKDVALPERAVYWTPVAFTAAADAYFYEKMEDYA